MQSAQDILIPEQMKPTQNQTHKKSQINKNENIHNHTQITHKKLRKFHGIKKLTPFHRA